jgi:hypothetical protein
MAAKKSSDQPTLEDILADCKRLREESKKIDERAKALSAKVEALRKASPKSPPKGSSAQ